MTDNMRARARQSFHVRPHPNGCGIWSDQTVHGVLMAVVFNKGPGSYDEGELATIMAAAQPVMFPALASIRNEARAMLNAGRADIPADIIDALRRIEQTAATALPVPTIEDLDGASPLPPAPSAQGVTVPHAALEHDREVVAALRQRVAELEALVAAGKVAPDEYQGVTERALLELTKAIFDAPTMAAGYEILNDWAWQCGHGVPVAMREGAPQVPAHAVPVDASKAVVTPAMCVAASDAAMVRGIILPASHAAAVIEAALSAAPPAPAPAGTDDLSVAKRIAWAIVEDAGSRYKNPDELWDRIVSRDLTEQYMRAARAARGEG